MSIDVNVNIRCADLAQVATVIASALRGEAAAPHQPTARVPADAPAAPPSVPTAPTTSAPVAPPPAPVVPTTSAPTYTLDQLGRAGAELITGDPGKREALVALLGQFGVQTIQDIKPQQFGAMATALRGMGAKI